MLSIHLKMWFAYKVPKGDHAEPKKREQEQELDSKTSTSN